ncbi:MULTISPECIES: hypothetical protein [Halomonadaceae]|uniref:Uncharacterized protein n=1 Tax=Modicisalibacter zincidurans TaxID=1178777 RepID=A0ABP9RE28_9GAMM|nr:MULTISPECIES: hypothetical protein [Halomonas]MCD6009836.1 hypothetical protein [Halomonas sp. IOP_31]
MTRSFWLAASLLLLAALAWLEAPQFWALATLDDALGNAFAAFAIARGLNATISVLQSSTVDLQVFQISVGEALDPANDMIERFSWVMFAATGSLALQKLLLGISANVVIKALVSGACILAAVLVALRARVGQAVALKLALACVFLRFAVLLVALASGLASEAFLDEPRQATMSQLETTEERLAEIADERIAGQQDAQSWWQQLKGSLDNLVGNPVASVVDGFDAITDKVVDLTMIFITQTVLFPLGFLYLLYRLGGRLFGQARLGGRFERRRLPPRE